MEIFGTAIEIEKLWIFAGVLIAFTEFLFPVTLSIWSGLAAVIVGLMIWTGLLAPESYVLQFIWFFSLTIALTLVWFFLLKKRFKGYANDMRDSSLSNLQGTVTKRIGHGQPGEVELFEPYHGIKKWRANSDETIIQGEQVEVYESDGIKLKVKKI